VVAASRITSCVVVAEVVFPSSVEEGKRAYQGLDVAHTDARLLPWRSPQALICKRTRCVGRWAGFLPERQLTSPEATTILISACRKTVQERSSRANHTPLPGFETCVTARTRVPSFYCILDNRPQWFMQTGGLVFRKNDKVAKGFMQASGLSET
jgi:hypothetical protein